LRESGERTGDEENVGAPRRRDEPEAESLDIVERIGERMNFELAGVAAVRGPVPPFFVES
jgi:hypothetical protein